jgi:hypothetical protein
MTPRLFMLDGWYAVQTNLCTIELFRYDVMEDNGVVEHYAHYCTVTCKNLVIDVSFIDQENFPWEMLRAVFEGAI